MRTNKQKCFELINTLPCPEHPAFVRAYDNTIFYKVKKMEYGTNMGDCNCGCNEGWISLENESLRSLFTDNKEIGSEFEQAVCLARIYFMDKGEIEKANLWKAFWEMTQSFRII